MIKEFLKFYKENKIKKNTESLKSELINSNLNYLIIQDLINKATNDVEILVTLKDGTKLLIKKARSEYKDFKIQPTEAF